MCAFGVEGRSPDGRINLGVLGTEIHAKNHGVSVDPEKDQALGHFEV